MPSLPLWSPEKGQHRVTPVTSMLLIYACVLQLLSSLGHFQGLCSKKPETSLPGKDLCLVP